MDRTGGAVPEFDSQFGQGGDGSALQHLGEHIGGERIGLMGSYDVVCSYNIVMLS